MTNTFKQTDLTKSVDKQTFSAYITGEGIKKTIISTLGNEGAQRFTASIVAAVSANKELASCEYSSIISSALLGESLKLSPSPQMGQYYIVPFNNKTSSVKTGQFILGYKGYIQLAIRSGKYKKLTVEEIKEGELINFNPLTEELKVELIQSELERKDKKTIGYYAMFELVNGFTKVLYWSYEKMLVHADRYSPAFRIEDAMLLWGGKVDSKDLWKYSSFWYKDFDAMAKKTMLRQLLSKWGIMSIDMQKGYENDTIEVNDIESFLPPDDNKENNMIEGEIVETKSASSLFN